LTSNCITVVFEASFGAWRKKVPITRIPEPYRVGFAKIKKLSRGEAESLVAGLEKSPPAGGIKKMIETASGHVPGLKKEDVDDIVRTLYSLYVYRADADTPLPDFISELISAMRVSGKDSLVLPEEEKVEFQDKMTKLLSLDALAVASKVELVRTDYAKTFHGAKILTDIRPIFAKPDQRPVGAAITHTLKIEYHEQGEHKEFYMALDAEDLQKLKAVLQRAEAKASSLRSLLENVRLTDLS
jgi:hypothetical protein